GHRGQPADRGQGPRGQDGRGRRAGRGGDDGDRRPGRRRPRPRADPAAPDQLDWCYDVAREPGDDAPLAGPPDAARTDVRHEAPAGASIHVASRSPRRFQEVPMTAERIYLSTTIPYVNAHL